MVVWATTRGMARIGVRGERTAWESIQFSGLGEGRRIVNVRGKIVDVNGKLREKPCIHNENKDRY